MTEAKDRTLMPSHSLPRGPERRARQRGARAWAWRAERWCRDLAVGLIPLTGAGVAGEPSGDGHAGLLVLRTAGTIGLSVAWVLVLALALLPAGLRARQARTAPLPRWQYLVLAAGWLAAGGGVIGAGLALGLRDAHPDWPARACAAWGAWLAVIGLVMAGRAACWGRARALLWWDRPPWLGPAPGPIASDDHRA